MVKLQLAKALNFKHLNFFYRYHSLVFIDLMLFRPIWYMDFVFFFFLVKFDNQTNFFETKLKNANIKIQTIHNKRLTINETQININWIFFFETTATISIDCIAYWDNAQQLKNNWIAIVHSIGLHQFIHKNFGIIGQPNCCVCACMAITLHIVYWTNTAQHRSILNCLLCLIRCCRRHRRWWRKWWRLVVGVVVVVVVVVPLPCFTISTAWPVRFSTMRIILLLCDRSSANVRIPFSIHQNK